MKKIISLIAVMVLTFNLKAQIYTAKAGATSITFYSEAPMENIEALNKGAVIVLKGSTNEIQIRVTMQNFKFKNALMEEHFNENYMETEKKVETNGVVAYPNRYGEFKGKINEPVDYTKEGENKVTLTGKMSIHGVTRDVNLDGTLTKKGNELIIYSKFPVKVADYEIKVPTMYVKNIAEVVDVTINSVLEPVKSTTVKIGMVKDEVVKLKGQPNKSSTTTTQKGISEILYYDNLKTVIGINSEGKVEYINTVK